MIKLTNSKIRKEIDTLFLGGDNFPEKLDKIKGIKLVEKRSWHEDRMDGYNCFVYIFGKSDIPFDFESSEITTTTGGCFEVRTPLDGDLVIYIDSKEEEQTHVGIFSDGKVLSKWSYGSIYSHDVNKVPTCYGDLAGFFRRSPTAKPK